MSMFLCPLCGKQNSIKNYHPENFDDDVEIFHNASLGYRRGFEKILGYDLEEFPELKDQIKYRINTISDFIGLQTETQEKVQEIEKELIDETRKRISAEEELEEHDIGPLLIKVNQVLGNDYTSIHSAVDELISRVLSLNESNKNLASINNNLQSRYSSFKNANKNLINEKKQLKNENKKLSEYNHQWDKAYRDLENNKNQKISEYSVRYNSEKDKRIKLEEYIEELDLDLLLKHVNNKIENEHTGLHSAIYELIYKFNSYEKEIWYALEFINNTLPEEYELFDDLDEALEAFYQYFEDQIEELSDE